MPHLCVLTSVRPVTGRRAPGGTGAVAQHKTHCWAAVNERANGLEYVRFQLNQLASRVTFSHEKLVLALEIIDLLLPLLAFLLLAGSKEPASRSSSPLATLLRINARATAISSKEATDWVCNQKTIEAGRILWESVDHTSRMVSVLRFVFE